MKKIIISILYITCLIPQLRAQETLSLKQCREMALTHNKEMAASFQQTESARYTMKSYKGNFFPNLTANATGLYSTANGGYSSGSGQLPIFSSTGQLQQFAFFPGINLDYKIGPMFLGAYNWNNHSIWAERFKQPTGCLYWETKWHKSMKH